MRTAGVIDVVYVNIVTWSVGCERVEQLLGDQGQEWMGIRTRPKKLGLQVRKKGIKGARGWVELSIVWRVNTVIYDL
jgi:hypothetical protein